MPINYALTDDICFKYIFKEEIFLSDFLNSFFTYLGKKKKVIGLKVTTEKEMYGTKRHNKVFYGDILVYLDTDEIVSIEMYTKFHEREFKKSLSYLTRAFSDQLKQGEDYLEIKKVISINLMTENYHLNNFQLLNNYGFINKFNYGQIKDEYLEMYLIRLDLVSNIVYNKEKIRFIRWLKFIKAKDLETRKKIVKKDKNMEKALAFMESFVNDEEVRNIYDKINDVEYYAKKEGLEKGQKEGLIKTAKNMLADGLDLKTISRYTGLTQAEIEKLKTPV